MSSHPVKKPSIKFQFQLPNLDGNGSLGISQSLRCFGEALQLNDFNKRMQLSNFYAVIPPRIILLLYTSFSSFCGK